MLFFWNGDFFSAESPALDTGPNATSPGPVRGKGKAEVPHKISYTVAGMLKGGGGDGGDTEKRGPKEGTVTAFTHWNLFDLKVRRGLVLWAAFASGFVLAHLLSGFYICSCCCCEMQPSNLGDTSRAVPPPAETDSFSVGSVSAGV